MIFNYLNQFFVFFKDYRNAFIKYSVLSVIAAFLELFGVAMTYPFIMSIISGSNSSVYSAILGFVIIGAFLLKNAFMVYYTYAQIDFTNKFELQIKKKIMNFYLTTSYQNSRKISLAEKNKMFDLIIPTILNNFVLRMLNLNINILIFVFIAACIAIKFPLATILSVICGVILVKYQDYIYKSLLNNASEKLSKTQSELNKYYNETILNLKSIKASGNEKYFYTNYSNALAENLDNNKKVLFLKTIPPFIVEPFAIVLLFVLLIVISYQSYTSPDKLVASFALIATAVFRLTPAIARIQVSLNGINASLPISGEFIDFYKQNNISKLEEISKKTFADFKQTLELKNISFEYETTPVLKDINLKINKGDFIGIVGLSGAGKTTLADILSGLFVPDAGEVLIDGIPADKPLKIGYIPQEPCLISGTILDNVTFGSSDISEERAIDSLKKAQIWDFIQEKYTLHSRPFTDSTGFSEGQKQRLAIARALYTEPDILVLDEATSSLDLKTENEICNVLDNLKGKTTIIVIAHRISTIRNSDKIIFLKNGTISECGTYNELAENSKDFAELVKLNFVVK